MPQKRIFDASNGNIVGMNRPNVRVTQTNTTPQPTPNMAKVQIPPFANPQRTMSDQIPDHIASKLTTHGQASLSNALNIHSMVPSQSMAQVQIPHAVPPVQQVVKAPYTQRPQSVPQEKKYDFDNPQYDTSKYKSIDELYDEVSKHMKIVSE